MLGNRYALDGKCVLIVGGLGWIGTCYSQEILRSGARLILFDHFPFEQFQDQFDPEWLERVKYYRFDGYAHDSFGALLDECFSRNARIDALINNSYDFSAKTGFTPHPNSIEGGTLSEWASAFDSGLIWPLIATQRFLKQKDLLNTKIVNISSMYGVIAPNPDNYLNTKSYMIPQYGMAKAGIVSFTKYVASYFGKQGVCCNAIAPGAIPKQQYLTQEFIDNLNRNIPLNRPGTPLDVAGMLLFLLSDDSSYITGQTFMVDGGWTIR